jgi:Cytochrome oxidase assembly factor
MPGEVLKLPVYFSIDPNIPNDIKTLTLSYTFYKIDNVANKKKINKIN